MRNRALLPIAARAGALLCMMWAIGACTHASANLMVDVPRMLPYQAPDIDEITGIDSDDAGQATGTGSGSAQKQHK